MAGSQVVTVINSIESYYRYLHIISIGWRGI